MIQKNSLKKEIVTYITILLVSALLLLGVGLLKVSENFFLIEKINSSRLLFTSLTATLHTIIKVEKINSSEEFLDNRHVQNILDSYGNNSSFLTITIVTHEGKSLYVSKKNTIDHPKLEENSNLPAGNGNASDEKNIKFAESLFIKGRFFGKINGIVNTKTIGSSFSRLWAMVGLYIFIDIVIFVFFGTYLLSKAVISPIKKMVEATKAVAHGDFTQKIPILKNNEIGKLCSAFNMMSEGLKEKMFLLIHKNAELKRAKDEVMQAEKLASVGLLAAGVAHEIGNPLSSIKTYIEILSMEDTIRDNSEFTDILRRMNNESERIDSIVRDLLSLSRPSKGIIQFVNINSIIKDTVKSIKNKKSFSAVTITTDLFLNVPHIQVDEQKIQQVIVNLLINSCDAMPKGGEIKIESKIIDYTQKDPSPTFKRRLSDPNGTDFSSLRITQSDEPPALTIFSEGERLIQLVFSDRGEGINKEHMSYIFDPFFTTKPPGKGTGLGLFICHRIISDMNGKIFITSSSKGTCIEIFLPIQGE